MSIEKSLSSAPQGLESLAPMDDEGIEIEIVDPEEVTIDLGGIEIKTQVTRNAGIAIWFADKVDMDVSYSTKRECWERMHLLAAEFLVKAGNSVHFFPATEVTYEETHDELDVNLCGVTYFMKLKERNGLNVCDLKI